MAKKLLDITAECIAINHRKNGGNVLLAVDVTEGTDKTGPQARKVLNYQTTDIKELSGFEVGKKVTVTFTA